jgi:sulfur-oxidizing protein SoxY
MAVPARRLLCSLALALTLPAWAGPFKPGDDPAASPVWHKVKASLFDTRAIAPAPAELLTLEAPSRALDGAVVPVALRTRVPAGAPYHVSKLYLIIDVNPSPVSGIFQFTPASGRAELELRVRVDDYTHMRAIAETSDGKLYMATRFVRAAGGCSAPAGGDAAAPLAALGKMQLSVQGDVKGVQPVLAQLAISHPNHTGLAKDQVTHLYTPAHYVRKVDVSYAGKPVFSADVDFSMSENPNFRFYFLPDGGNGELKATVTDTKDLKFTAALAANDAR